MLNPIKHIIVPTDFSEVSDIAERSAVALAARDGAAIHLLHVIRLPFFHTSITPRLTTISVLNPHKSTVAPVMPLTGFSIIP
jgi:nucleotide-binding universal stress UspA family protein